MSNQSSVNKYNTSRIYMIKCNTTGKCYIGSTTQLLSKRLSGHKADYTYWRCKKSTKYMTSFEVLENRDYEIKLIEEVNVDSNAELQRIEGEYIKIMECVNKCIAGRTNKEYKRDVYGYATFDKIDEPDEFFVPFPKYPNYEISNLCRVRNIKSNRILKQHTYDDITCIALSRSGKVTWYKVLPDRLVRV